MRYRVDMITDQGTQHQLVLQSDEDLLGARPYRHLEPGESPLYDALAHNDGGPHRIESVLRKPQRGDDGEVVHEQLENHSRPAPVYDYVAIASLAHFKQEIEADGRRVIETVLRPIP